VVALRWKSLSARLAKEEEPTHLSNRHVPVDMVNQRELINRIAAYGTARATLLAICESLPMFVLEFSFIIAFGVGTLQGGSLVSAAIAISFLATIFNLVVTTVRVRSFAASLALTPRQYLPALLEMRPPLPLHALERDRVTELVVGVKPNRAEAHVLCRLISRSHSLRRIDISGLGLVDADLQQIGELCARSEVLRSLDLLGNSFSAKAADSISKICAKAKPQCVRTLCGLREHEVIIDLSNKELGDVDAVLLTFEVGANTSIRLLNLLGNKLQDARYFAQLCAACESVDLCAAMERRPTFTPPRESTSTDAWAPSKEGADLKPEEVVRCLVLLGTVLRVTIGEGVHCTHRGSPILHGDTIAHILDAMRKNFRHARAQAWGCEAISRICLADFASDGPARETAVRIGAFSSIISALREHIDEEDVQREGCSALAAICVGPDFEARARADIAVSSGALEVVVVTLNTHAKMELAVSEMGSLAMASIVEGEDERGPSRRQALVQCAGPAAIMLALESHPLAARLQAVGLRALAATCADSDELGRQHAGAVLGAGAAGVAVAALGAHPWSSPTQTFGLSLLANLAEGEDFAAAQRQRVVVDAGGLRSCVAALDTFKGPSKIELVSEAVRVLRNVSIDEYLAGKCVEANCLPALVRSITTHQSDVHICRDGLRAIAQCSRAQGSVTAGNRAHVAATSGALGAIAAAMLAHAADSAMQGWGSAAGCNITSGTDAAAFWRQSVAVHDGAISAIMEAMEGNASSAATHEWGALALRNVVRTTQPGSRRLATAVIDSGAARALIAAMHANPTSASIQATAAEACAHLARGSSSDESLRAPLLGVTPSVTAFSHATSVSDSSSVTMSPTDQNPVESFGEDAGATDRRNALIEAGAHEVLASAMGNFRGHAMVQLWSCTALRHLATGSDWGCFKRREAIAAEGAPKLLAEAAVLHPKNGALQAEMCLAVAFVAAGTDAAAVRRKTLFVEAGAMRALAQAVKSHASMCEASGTYAFVTLADGPDAASDEGGLSRAAEGALAVSQVPSNGDWVLLIARHCAAHAHPPGPSRTFSDPPGLSRAPSLGIRPPLKFPRAPSTSSVLQLPLPPGLHPPPGLPSPPGVPPGLPWIHSLGLPHPERGCARLLLAFATQFHTDARVCLQVAISIGSMVDGTAGTPSGNREQGSRGVMAVDAGALEALVVIMDAHPADGLLQCAATTCAAALCAGEGEQSGTTRERALSVGLPRPVMQALVAHTVLVEVAVGALLGHLAEGADELLPSGLFKRAYAIVTAGDAGAPVEAKLKWVAQLSRVVELVVELAASKRATDVDSATNVEDDDEDRPAPAPVQGALRILSTIAAGYLGDSGVVRDAFAAIVRIVIGSEGGAARNALYAANAGAMGAAVQAMKQHPSVLPMLRAASLVIAVVSGLDHTRFAAARAKEAGALHAGCAVIADHFSGHDLSVTAEAVDALRAVVGPAAGTAGSSADAAGTVKAVTNAMRILREDGDAQEVGCRAFSRISSSGPAGVAAVSGALPALALAMEKYPKHLELLRYALAATAECLRVLNPTSRTRADRAVDAGLHVVASKIARAHIETVQTLSAALDVLACIAGGNDANAETRREAVYGEANALDLLVLALRTQPASSEVQALCANLMGSLAHGAPSAESGVRTAALIGSGCATKMLEAHATHAGDLIFVEAACLALCQLTAPMAGADERVESLVKAGALPLLVAALHSHAYASLPLAQSAVCAARNLLAREDAVGQARRQGVCDIMLPVELVRAMQAHPADAVVQLSGCIAFKHIATSTSDTDTKAVWRKEAVVDANALPALVSAMGLVGEGSAGVSEQAARALATIVAGTDKLGLARKEKAYDAHAIPALVVAMRGHASLPNNQEACCYALRNICFGTGDRPNVQRKSEAVECGALAAAVLAMSTHSESAGMQAAGCGAITSIGFGSDNLNSHVFTLSFAQLALDANALPAVLQAMGKFTGQIRVQEQGVKALRNLAYGGDKKAALVQQEMAAQGAIEAIVCAMNTFPGDAPMHVDACKAIEFICDTGGAAQKRANAANARQAIAASMRHFKDNAHLQEAAAHAMHTI